MLITTKCIYTRPPIAKHSANFEFRVHAVKMPKSYSNDLRWRAVWLAIVREMSCKEISDVLFMCERSVYRYLYLFYTTGSVSPLEHASGPPKMLNDFEEFIILQSLLYKPTLYLHEVQEEVVQDYRGLG